MDGVGRIGRRGVLGLLGGALSAPALLQAEPLRLHDGPADFRHGVASGDPGQHGSSCGPASRRKTTRARPIWRSIWKWRKIPPSAGCPALAGPACIGSAGLTIKILADGLEPGVKHFYRFRGVRRSPPSAAPGPCRRAAPTIS